MNNVGVVPWKGHLACAHYMNMYTYAPHACALAHKHLSAHTRTQIYIKLFFT